MPTAILISNVKRPGGNITQTEVTKTITHNNARLYHENGRTYVAVGIRAGNRVYKDTQKRG